MTTQRNLLKNYEYLLKLAKTIDGIADDNKRPTYCVTIATSLCTQYVCSFACARGTKPSCAAPKLVVIYKSKQKLFIHNFIRWGVLLSLAV